MSGNPIWGVLSSDAIWATRRYVTLKSSLSLTVVVILVIVLVPARASGQYHYQRWRDRKVDLENSHDRKILRQNPIWVVDDPSRVSHCEPVGSGYGRNWKIKSKAKEPESDSVLLLRLMLRVWDGGADTIWISHYQPNEKTRFIAQGFDCRWFRVTQVRLTFDSSEVEDCEFLQESKCIIGNPSQWPNVKGQLAYMARHGARYVFADTVLVLATQPTEWTIQDYRCSRELRNKVAEADRFRSEILPDIPR